MKHDRSNRRRRLAVWGAFVGFLLANLAGCGANGGLFGRRETPPPATMSEFLSLPRPK